MGFLRFFLAFCVVNVHAGLLGVNLFPSDAAVQAFYVISGFYMAMVLNEKYNRVGTTYSDFILSRFFRIFPAYLLVSFLTILVGVIAVFFFGIQIPPFSHGNELFKKFGITSLIAFIFPQIFLIGLDAIHFFTLDGLGDLVFTKDFSEESPQLWRSLVVPQAWSLSVELYFYLLAPFIVRRSANFLFFIICISLFIRLVIAIFLESRFDPWSYRFFPSELMFFLCGSLAYRLSNLTASRVDSWNIDFLKIMTFFVILVAGLVGRYGLGGKMLFYSPFAIGLLFFALPALFSFTKNIRFDRYIGELSYPLYISHMLVIWIADLIFTVRSMHWRLTVFFASISLAILIYELLDRKVDLLRHNLFSNEKS